jgi:predicted oxidoreductase (fatty acid repression mutant protein)
MKLNELEARKIIQMVMGDKRILTKSDEELALILKKRLTKKECEAFNAQVNGTVDTLGMEHERYLALIASATKKIKNESVHGDFFYTKGE